MTARRELFADWIKFRGTVPGFRVSRQGVDERTVGGLDVGMHLACDEAAELVTFEQFFAVNYAAMVRLATMLVGSNAVAEELVQDTFARVHRQLPRLANPDAYLRVAVVNACRNEIRRRRAARRVTAERIEPAFDVHDELLDLLARLSPRQRAAIVLRFYEQATEREIAEALGCRPGTVKSLLHRALAHLRKELRVD